MPHPRVKAGELPLSYESKKFIAIAAVLGGALAGGIGFAIGCDEQAQNKALANAVFWDKIKSFPWSYVILPTLIGALVSGGISSFFTTEAYLDSAQKELAELEHDALFINAIQGATPEELTRFSFNNKFPAVRTYEKMDSLHYSLNQVIKYLKTVVYSGIKPLENIARAILERLENYQSKLIDSMIALKNNAHYLRELVACHQLETLEQLAFAQQQAALAQQRAADAAWRNAMHYRPTIPVVILNR
jgi:hypothetical protein